VREQDYFFTGQMPYLLPKQQYIVVLNNSAKALKGKTQGRVLKYSWSWRKMEVKPKTELHGDKWSTSACLTVLSAYIMPCLFKQVYVT